MRPEVRILNPAVLQDLPNDKLHRELALAACPRLRVAQSSVRAKREVRRYHAHISHAQPLPVELLCTVRCADGCRTVHVALHPEAGTQDLAGTQPVSLQGLCIKRGASRREYSQPARLIIKQICLCREPAFDELPGRHRVRCGKASMQRLSVRTCFKGHARGLCPRQREDLCGLLSRQLPEPHDGSCRTECANRASRMPALLAMHRVEPHAEQSLELCSGDISCEKIADRITRPRRCEQCRIEHRAKVPRKVGLRIIKVQIM